MDALVYVSRDPVGAWDVYARDPKDLRLGSIHRDGDGQFLIRSETESLRQVKAGPYSDLDSAMEAIPRHIGGRCETWSP